MALGKFISALDIHFLAQLSIACTVTVLHKKQNKNVKPLTFDLPIIYLENYRVQVLLTTTTNHHLETKDTLLCLVMLQLLSCIFRNTLTNDFHKTTFCRLERCDSWLVHILTGIHKNIYRKP